MNNEHRATQALLRSWPFPRGAGRIIDRFFSHLSFSQETVIVRTTDDFYLSVAPNDLIGRHIYLTGEFDRSIVEILCNFSEPNDLLLDVGANIGYVSTCFLRNVPNSSVIAVEPQPRLLQLLKTNLSRFGHYQIYPYAIGDADGETCFELNDANSGAGRVVSEGTAQTIKLSIRSADRLFSELNIEKLDLLKIDAEGCEELILKACRLHLDRLQPRAIIFEEQCRKSAPSNSIGLLLSEIGYDTFGIKKSLRRLDLVRIKSEADCVYNDYIAVSRKREIPVTACTGYALRR